MVVVAGVSFFCSSVCRFRPRITMRVPIGIIPHDLAAIAQSPRVAGFDTALQQEKPDVPVGKDAREIAGVVTTLRPTGRMEAIARDIPFEIRRTGYRPDFDLNSIDHHGHPALRFRPIVARH